MSHPENKKIMCQFFSRMVISELGSLQKLYIVVHGTEIISNIPEWDIESHSQHEADTLLLCIIRQLSSHPRADAVNPPTFRILSPDTDVFILSIYLTTQITGMEIVFELLTCQRRKVVPIKSVVDSLGSGLCEALLGAYVFTGCDYTGRFNKITKSRALKTLRLFAEDEAIISSLRVFGGDEEIAQDVIDSLSLFTVKLYLKRQDDLNRYSHLKDVGSLRWELYSKHQDDGDVLPPTEAALKYHIMRANYVTLMWKRSILSFHPTLPDCCVDQGWNIEDGKLAAVMTDILPAPEFCIEMISCKCKKSKYVTNQCGCHNKFDSFGLF